MNVDIRFDFERRKRIGLIEAIWGEDKTLDQLKRVSKAVLEKKEVVFIYLGDLLFDARITNMAQSLIKNNYKVSFIGICNKPPSFSLYQNIKIYNLSIS